MKNKIKKLFFSTGNLMENENKKMKKKKLVHLIELSDYFNIHLYVEHNIYVYLYIQE